MMRMIIPLLNLKARLPKLLYVCVGAVTLILLTSTLVTNELYAQIFHSAVPNNSTLLLLQQQHQASQKIHVVKITSPAGGQQVAAGKNLIVSGTSVDNTTSDCNVSVIVNGVKPYRLASANADTGHKDYSKWNFTLTPAYTIIKQGQNKITAKFSCTNEPNLISHNSVNVTGVGTSFSPIAKQQGQQGLPPSASKNSTTPNVNATTSDAISPVTSSSSNPNFANANNKTNSSSTMSVSIHLTTKSVHPGDKQGVVIKVTDANSTFPVVGASVLGRVTDPSGGTFKKLAGTTDDTGKSSYSWTVSQGDTTGKYKAIIDVSAYGYKNSTASKTFQVIPITTSSTTSNNNLILPLTNANNSNNNHHNSPSTIIPIPHIRIPIIKVPFHLPFQ